MIAHANGQKPSRHDGIRGLKLGGRYPVAVVILAFALLMAGGAGAVWCLQQLYATPTAEEYLAKAGPRAQFIAAGALRFDGESFTCGRFPAIFDAMLDDYGAAYFGFVLLNPARFQTLPLILKHYAYAHECGHQYVGYDEGGADCYAVRRGKAEGWLDDRGMDAVCDFISRSKGDSAHAFGVRRCAMMRRCLVHARPGRERL